MNKNDRSIIGELASQIVKNLIASYFLLLFFFYLWTFNLQMTDKQDTRLIGLFSVFQIEKKER